MLLGVAQSQEEKTCNGSQVEARGFACREARRQTWSRKFFAFSRRRWKMNGSMKIQVGHLDRQAAVYVRQSSPQQVLRNRESGLNQRALRERLVELGWPKNRVSVIDEDQGLSGKHSAGRDGFQKLAADVALNKIGIIMGYEVSRVARNCADWYRLLELSAIFDTLIGDVDGIYNPRDYNDRLLLGLKGTMSEAELHSLRLRLDAGRLSKAKRGELVQHLPTGLVRTTEGSVIFDPDTSVCERIGLPSSSRIFCGFHSGAR